MTENRGVIERERRREMVKYDRSHEIITQNIENSIQFKLLLKLIEVSLIRNDVQIQRQLFAKIYAKLKKISRYKYLAKTTAH